MMVKAGVVEKAVAALTNGSSEERAVALSLLQRSLSLACSPSISLYQSLSRSLALSLPPSLSLALSLSLSLFLCLSLACSIPVSLSLSRLRPVSVSLPVSGSISLSLFLCKQNCNGVARLSIEDGGRTSLGTEKAEPI